MQWVGQACGESHQVAGEAKLQAKASALDIHRIAKGRIAKFSTYWYSLNELPYWVQERTKMSSWLLPSKSLPSSRWGEKDAFSTVWEALIWDYPWNGNPAPAFSLGKLHDRRVWCATVHGVTKSQTGLSDWGTKIKERGIRKEPPPLPPTPCQTRTGSCGGVRLEYKRRGTSQGAEREKGFPSIFSPCIQVVSSLREVQVLV